jgi:hypothetical protein
LKIAVSQSTQLFSWPARPHLLSHKATIHIHSPCYRS